jgi:diadenosine tetraphosphate (Ap4A) HIT family hydrolase
MSCLFCKSISRSLASVAIISDKSGCAVAEINCGGLVHVLIVPRAISHSGDGGALPRRNMGQLMGIAEQIANARHFCEGYRISVSA